ncbi:MAG: hypothetical protein JST11_22895 [Acidobacteria bacterium]|nr:hypothetical protein [Acidobacteriota bacterium]
MKQLIHVTVSHPEAARWGFQLTARLVSDDSKPAGTFTPDSIVKVLCDSGTPAPCSDTQTEFAEHSNAPRGTPGAGYTFDVTWTPPATDVGDIVFYAAGNAADGNGAPTNDRIYTTSRRISPPCALTQKPSIRSAVNGASFQGAWNVGAMMSVFGANFAPTGKTRAVTAADLVARKFPQSLACIAVQVNGQNAPIAYVQQDQINLQAPSLAGLGTASIVVIANPGTPNELRSDPLSVSTQAAYAPALFTFDGKTAAATTADGKGIVANPNVVAGASPARPGDIVTLYATGLGNTDPAYAPGDIASAAAPATGTLTATVGGITLAAADVLYAGASPGSICGLQQVNLRLPAALPDGDVPVVLAVNGAQSPAGVTIPVKK